MYVLVVNNEVVAFPYGPTQLRRDTPKASLPAVMSEDFLAARGVYPVIEVQPKPTNSWQKIALGETVTAVDGQWYLYNTLIDYTHEEFASTLLTYVRTQLDNFAKERGYDSILSACSYATSLVPTYAVEGQHCVGIRDTTWDEVATYLENIVSGSEPMPSSYADVTARLPALVWP